MGIIKFIDKHSEIKEGCQISCFTPESHLITHFWAEDKYTAILFTQRKDLFQRVRSRPSSPACSSAPKNAFQYSVLSPSSVVVDHHALASSTLISTRERSLI